jgi:PAS domain S-box-containing protein
MDDQAQHRTRGANEELVPHLDKQKEEMRPFKESNTEIQHSNDKYKIDARVASIGVWDWNMKLNVMVWDDKLYEIYGIPPQDFISYESWTKHIHPDDLPAVEDSINRALENQSHDYAEFRIIRPDGSIRYIGATAGLIRDNKNKITRVVGVNFDLTEQKMAEDALMKSEQELRVANATKDKLFSILAHDLVSPFTSVLGYSKLLMLGSIEQDFEKVSVYSQFINRAATQTFDLLTNLLEWSRSQRDKIQFQPEMICLKKIIEKVNLLYLHMLDDKEIYIEIKIPNDFVLFADSNMVYTIIRNLVANAIKYSEEEGIIKLTAGRNAEHVEICISDTGKGISKEDLEQIINTGLNFSTNDSDHKKGTGLGLIICKDFVERHGGKIWIESEENIGTRVYFTIPENPRTPI